MMLSANGRETAVCRPWSKVVSTDRKTPVKSDDELLMSAVLFLNKQQEFHLLM